MNHDNKNERSLLSAVRSAALDADLPWNRILRTLSAAVLAALISGATLFGISRPFGIALIAASEGWLMSAAAMIGTAAGSAASPDFLPVAAAALLLFLARITVGVWLKSSAASSEALPTPAGRSIGQRICTAVIRMGATESIWLRAAFGAAASMTAGAISLFLGGDYSLRPILSVLFSAAAAPLVTLAFSTLTVRQLMRTHFRDAGICVLLFAVVRALRDAAGIPFSAGAIAAFAASLLAARGFPQQKGIPRSDAGRIMTGVLSGVVAGFAMDPGGPPLYAAAALAAGIVFPFSAAGAVCAGWVCAMGISFAGGGLVSFAAIMPELTVTAALLVPLLQFRLIPAPAKAPPVSESQGAAVLEAQISSERADEGSARMRTLAQSLRDLAEKIASLSRKTSRPPLSEVKKLCGDSFDARCGGCENRILCRERECSSLTEAISRISTDLHRQGRISAARIPPSISRRCASLDEILTEIEENWNDISRRAAENDKSDVFAEDFCSLAALLDDAACQSEEEYSPDEEVTDRLKREMAAMDLYAGHVTVYGSRRRRILAQDLDLTRVRMSSGEIRRAMEKLLSAPLSDPEYRIDGERVSLRMDSIPRFSLREGSFSRAAEECGSGSALRNGDCASAFETEDGRYYMLICDGMGTGGEAAVTARMSAAFLRQLLCAGAQMNAALTMLNSYLRHRNMECSAGIDLMEIDRYTGEAKFVKSGAAPSFVLREGRLFRLCSKTVPIGILRALDAEMIRFELRPGDSIVMVSDGVSGNLEESAWLCDLLSSPAVVEESPEDIAEKIVRAASAGDGRRDDVTAAVVKVEGREMCSGAA